MSYGYSFKNTILGGATSVDVPQNQTKMVISEPVKISSMDAENLWVAIKTSVSVEGGGIDFILQHAMSPTDTFEDTPFGINATTDAGSAQWFIPYNFLLSVFIFGNPFILLPFVRIVATTGAGASCTVTAVNISRRFV